MYTIVCKNGHKREDARPRGICTVCGLSMSPVPRVRKQEQKPKEALDG